MDTICPTCGHPTEYHSVTGNCGGTTHGGKERCNCRISLGMARAQHRVCTCGHSEAMHSNILDGAPCNIIDCSCALFVFRQEPKRNVT